MQFSDQPKTKVKYYKLLKYASAFEIIMFTIGILCSVFVGVSLPIAFLFFSDVVDDFILPIIGNFIIAIKKLAVWGAIKFVMAFIQMFCLKYCARRQARHIRQLLFSVGLLCLVRLCF